MPRRAKSKLTPELQEKILLHLRVGAYVETAAARPSVGTRNLALYEKQRNEQWRGTRVRCGVQQAVGRVAST